MKARRPMPAVSVFFFTHLSRPIGVHQLARLLAPLGPVWAARALANLARLRRLHPGLAVVSVRELFAGAEAHLRAAALNSFRRAGALLPEPNAAPVHGAAAPTVRYGGPFPKALAAADARWLFARMREIQGTAAAVLREGLALSPTHVVLSARRGAFLAITATDTDKSQVQLYSQTPLATPAGRGWIYYGDPNFRPSTELASHWALHAALGAGAGACLLHFHHAGLRDAACPGAVLTVAGRRVPCVARSAYGSALQGRRMAAAMRTARSRAVTLAEHGTWFAAPGFVQALSAARRIVRGWEDVDARDGKMLQLKKSRKTRGPRGPRR